MPAAPHPWSQEEILEAAVASLTEADIPPDQDDPGGWTDPDGDRPDGLADLITPELEQLTAEGPAPAPAFGPAGFLPRDGSGHGAGFADGGVLDGLAPGPGLAGFADDAHRRLTDVDDDALIGVMHGWRRLAAWAQARELATITELARRRPADGAPPAPPGQLPARMSEFIADEVALALTLTVRSADAKLGLALDLGGRPATFAALEAGRIDLPRARIIVEGVSTLEAEHADAVEAAVLPRAPGLTTGQLRAIVGRAVLAVDPQAARRRREETEKNARVDCWPEPCGTASLAGWHLPSAQALAADKRLCQIAAAWRKQGAVGETDLLRARAYLALLLGLPIDAPPADLLPPADPPVPGSPPPGNPPLRRTARARRPRLGPGTRQHYPGSWYHACRGPAPGPGSALPPLAGTVNLTVPLTTLLGLNQEPGQAAGYGPLDADTARALACAAAGHRATRWQITVTAPDGTALAHGTAARRSGAMASGARADRRPGAARRVDGRRHRRAGGHRIVRPPALRTRLPAQPCPAAADPGSLQHLHRARLPPPRHGLRPRPHPCLRRRRVDLRMQPGPTLQTAPPRETGAGLAVDAATAWGTDLDHAEWARLFHPARELSLITAPGPGRSPVACCRARDHHFRHPRRG